MFNNKTEQEIQQQYPLLTKVRLANVVSIIYSDKVKYSSKNLYCIYVGGTKVYDYLTDTWAEKL